MGNHQNPILLLFILPLLLPLSAAQTPAAPPPPPLSPLDSCIGVYLNYTLGPVARISPVLPGEPSKQPYSFSATANILNTDSVPLESWSFHLDFLNSTVLVSASSAVLTDGSDFPYIVGSNGSPGASFSGSPNTDLKTAIETAGDLTQTGATIDIRGTAFGIDRRSPKIVTALSLDNAGFVCKDLTVAGVNTTLFPDFHHVCCTRDPKFKPNSSISERFSDRITGDLTISYDVMQSYDSSYMALVTIDNQSPLGRLDNWRLNWTWMQGEFILKMQGAHTTVTDPSDCLFGPQGQFYKEFDFSTVMNCQKTPTIVDLPLAMANDTKLGLIPSCCRNGTILPAVMDPTKSSSAFQVQVFKMPPNLNRTKLAPPQNWHITGSDTALNPTYNCSQPIRVSPSKFPDPSGLPTSTAAVASWQVVCNIVRRKRAPRCCVSFSSFYNESVIPCKTCACGCPANVGQTCSARAPALFLPSEALLVPFDNRTAKAKAWAEIKHFNVPNPLPCGDFCGVSINWHVYTDYSNGWSARITLFNWEDVDIPDWFGALELDNAYDGYEQMYSFNGSAVGNKTIFMQGMPGLNYLVKEDSEKDPKDPGKLQTVISFTKRTTPNMQARDFYPSKLFFNGEECSLPEIIPTNHGHRTSSSVAGSLLALIFTLLLSLLVLME